MRRWLWLALVLACSFARSCVFVEPVCAGSGAVKVETNHWPVSKGAAK